MGITEELKGTYEYYKFLDKCSLNNIIAEDIRDYVNMYLLDNKDAIIREYGSVESFSHVMAENFTSNGGKFVISEEKLNEFNIGALVGRLGAKAVPRIGRAFVRGGVKKATGTTFGILGRSVSQRFGSKGAQAIAKHVGKKSVGRLTFTDVGKYVSRNLTKGANPAVARQIEKQAALLAKHTTMDAATMEKFMAKYAFGPHGCDAKLWNKAFLSTAKKYHGGVKFTDDLVVNEYNALARQAGKATIGRAAGNAVGSTAGTSVGGRVGRGRAGGAAGGVAGTAAGTTLAGRAGRALMRAPIVLAKGTGKILKKMGLFCLRHPIKAAIGAIIIYEGWKWIKGEDGLFRRIQQVIDYFRSGKYKHGGDGNSVLGNSLEAVFPKNYGAEYLGENPEDYRVI